MKVINKDVNKVSKEPDIIDKVGNGGIQGFKYTKKATSFSKKIFGVIDLFTEVPAAFDEIFLALKSFKIIKGMLALPKLGKSALKIIKPKISITNRVIAGWKIIKSTKKIVGAVETVFSYLQKLKVLTKADLAWTKVTGIIFLPITFISTIFATYKFGKQTEFYVNFSKRVKVAKRQGPEALCQELLAQEKTLKKFKVITKKAELKPRLKNILKALKSENKEIAQKAKDETIQIAKSLRNRASEHVGILALKTNLKIAGAVMTIIALACPPAAAGLTLAALPVAAASVGTFIYSKWVPKNEIKPGEQRLIFATIFKGGRRFKKGIQHLATQFQIKIAELVKTPKLPKALAAA